MIYLAFISLGLPDSPETATKEWGEEMLKATADFCVDFIKKFERVSLG